MSREIEVLARALCFKDGCLLLCHTKGARNTYLPGGHVEFGESAVCALKRELAEELGIRFKVKRFVGAVEHTFVQRGIRHCEINLVFEVAARGLTTKRVPVACEDYIEFQWVPIRALGKAKLEPRPLRNLVKRLLAGKRAGWWGSTLPHSRVED